MTGVAESQVARSVLEQTSLDDFMSSAELARATFDAVRGEHLQPVDCSARLVSAGPAELSTAEQERIAAARRVYVPIPRRPAWHEGISSDELAGLEGEAFLNWRRSLARIEETEALVMTPYEKNLDFWRQLWRCVERADVLVQILDARDPDFYRSHDLERYVGEWGTKRHLLVVNKADFLSADLLRRWSAHFAAAGVDVVFFSALRELHRQQRLPGAAAAEGGTASASATALPPHGPLVGDDGGVVLDCGRLLEELRKRLPDAADAAAAQDPGNAVGKRGVVGFVGYPNVGKSSVINALFGAKKVSMSRTPGKTKHLQTLELPDGITLCDCPGLVFPSVVASKAHLCINGTVPIDELRDSLAPARIVVEKVGAAPMLQKYSLSADMLQEAATRLGDELAAADLPRALMAALALARQHFLRAGVPDEGWGARKILREYVTGELLHCEPPMESGGFSPPPRGGAGTPVVDEAPGAQAAAPFAGAADTAKLTASGAAAEKCEPQATVVEASDSDFSDLEDFLQGRASERGMTKRKARQQNRLALKGGAVMARAPPAR